MKNKVIIILSLTLLFLMITMVSASEINSTDTISTTDNIEVNVCENNTGEVAVAALSNTNSENTSNNMINVEGFNETSSTDDGFNTSDENPTPNFELEQSNNIIDNSIKNKEEILGATSNILTISSNHANTILYDLSNEDNILDISSNELLSEQYPTKTYTISDGIYYLNIEIKFLGNNLYKFEIKEFSNGWIMLYMFNPEDQLIATLNEGRLKVGDSGEFEIVSGAKVKFRSISNYYGSSFYSQLDYLPTFEVNTYVSVTNPSIKYNSGEFSVSGTETVLSTPR